MNQVEALEVTLAKFTWLTEEHTATVELLRLIARLIDENPMPALLAQYGLNLRDLVKQTPTQVEEVDQLARLLKR